MFANDSGFQDEAAVRHNLVLTKESRSMHRRLLTTMGDTNTDFFKVNQLKVTVSKIPHCFELFTVFVFSIAKR